MPSSHQILFPPLNLDDSCTCRLKYAVHQNASAFSFKLYRIVYSDRMLHRRCVSTMINDRAIRLRISHQ